MPRSAPAGAPVARLARYEVRAKRVQNSRFGPHNGPVLFGVLLYLAWVVSSGADLAGGRLLAAPFLAATLLLVRQRWQPFARFGMAPLGVILTLGLLAPHPTITSNETFGSDAPQPTSAEVRDERWLTYQKTGLLMARFRFEPYPDTTRVERQIARLLASGASVQVTPEIGLFAYTAGKRLTIADPLGRTDLLLARRPPTAPWRPGYLPRRMPEGYAEKLAGSAGQLPYPPDARADAVVNVLARQPVWSWARLRAVLRENVVTFGGLRRHGG